MLQLQDLFRNHRYRIAAVVFFADEIPFRACLDMATKAIAAKPVDDIHEATISYRIICSRFCNQDDTSQTSLPRNHDMCEGRAREHQPRPMEVPFFSDANRITGRERHVDNRER